MENIAIIVKAAVFCAVVYGYCEWSRKWEWENEERRHLQEKLREQDRQEYLRSQAVLKGIREKYGSASSAQV